MNRALQIVVVVFITLLTLLGACSKRDRVINVAGDDPEMLAAIVKAHDTLPQFWDAFEKQEHGESEFALKVAITDARGTEHFWAVDIERRDGKIMGTINNDPNIVTTVEFGDRIEIPEADISDWLYMRDGKMVGNETLKPLLKRMPAEEAAQLKSIMANP